VEKQSRNKSKLSQHNTSGIVSKFDSNMFELQFKQSLGNSQGKLSKSGLSTSKTNTNVNLMNN
jgi:hypothetical protein